MSIRAGCILTAALPLLLFIPAVYSQVACTWDGDDFECDADVGTLNFQDVQALLTAIERIELCLSSTTCPAEECTLTPFGPSQSCLPIGFTFTSPEAANNVTAARDACAVSCADEQEAYFYGFTGCVGCGLFAYAYLNYNSACRAKTTQSECEGAVVDPTTMTFVTTPPPLAGSATAATPTTVSNAPDASASPTPATSGNRSLSNAPTPVPSPAPAAPQSPGSAYCTWLTPGDSEARCWPRANGPYAVDHDNIIYGKLMPCFLKSEQVGEQKLGCKSDAPQFCAGFFNNRVCLPVDAPYTLEAEWESDFDLFAECFLRPVPSCHDFWTDFFTKWGCPNCIPEAHAITAKASVCSMFTTEYECMNETFSPENSTVATPPVPAPAPVPVPGAPEPVTSDIRPLTSPSTPPPPLDSGPIFTLPPRSVAPSVPAWRLVILFCCTIATVLL